MALAAGARLGPYQIVGLLGAGGMGEVYKARDTRLDRSVAIKILPSADPELRARFAREAKAIAALTHPHICTLHDVGHHEGTDYLVMEYVEGETLERRLRRGPLTITDALRFAIEIADALDKAHRGGFVHRDLKPSNVMLTAESQTKVMDFGVAKRIPGADTDPASLATMTVTGTGELAGTLTYMSPEQLRGLPVDGRSDIFAFGLLLHQMVTGAHPFWKSSPISTIDAILNAPPPMPDGYAKDAPPLLAHVISRCLAKDRNERYQSFRDVGIELKALGDAPASPLRLPVGRLTRQSPWLVAAAVATLMAGGALMVRYWPASLPLSQRALAFKERDWIIISDFDNLTGDKVFDRSLHAALEVGISQSQFVNVFPASRLADTLKRMQKPAVDRMDDALASEIAVREGIKAVIACSIAQVGDVYSLTARLIDPQSRSAVLTESTRAKGKDQVLTALDDLATRVRRNLGESLSRISTESVPLPQVTTWSLDALRLYADSLQPTTSEETAEDLLRQAIALDPNFALAHAELGRRYYLDSARAIRLDGEAQFVKALGLLDRLSTRERLWIRAVAEDSRGNRREAVDAYKSYLAQYPDDPRGWFRIGWTQMAGLGELEPALEAFKRVIELDRSSAGAHVNVATCYSGLDKRREAVEEYRKAFALDPQLMTGDFVNHEYGFTLVQLGELDAAAEVFKTMIANRDKRKSARGHRSLALLEMYRGRYTTAVIGLRQAVLINHAEGAAVSEFRDRLFLARALEAKGMTRAVESELTAVDRLVARMSLDPNWLGRLAKMRARAGRVREARIVLALMSKTAGDATADSSVSRNTAGDEAPIDLVKGEIELAEGRPESAAKLFEAAKVVEPGDSDALESLAAAAVAAGQLDEGAKFYEELIARRPLGHEGQEHWFRAHVRLGDVYERLGRADRARLSYEGLLGTWKNGDADLVALKDAKARLTKLNEKLRRAG